jgi:transcriptional regulator GlxA family with amidase domain
LAWKLSLRASMMPCSIRSSSSADGSIHSYPPSHSAVSWTLRTDVGALRARQLDYWTVANDDALAICSAPSARLSIHPVEADRIYCRDGNIWTSAGITAGIDLSLALIEEDHGFDIAKSAAQHLVVYHRRHGGQSQFAASVDLAPKNNRISTAVGYARDHIAEALTLEHLADAVGMSRRQFSRAFRAQTGTTPARVVERLRADMARGRIETTAEPVERIAEAVGFGDAENMRRAFIRIYGQPPQSIRRAIRI